MIEVGGRAIERAQRHQKHHVIGVELGLLHLSRTLEFLELPGAASEFVADFLDEQEKRWRRGQGIARSHEGFREADGVAIALETGDWDQVVVVERFRFVIEENPQHVEQGQHRCAWPG